MLLKLIQCLLLCTGIASNNVLNATENTLPLNFPGGVAILNIKKLSEDLPDVKYGLTEPAILDQGRYWSIIIGIGLNTLPGEYVVYIKHGGKGVSGLHKKIIVRQHTPSYFQAKSKQIPVFESLHLNHKTLSNIDFENTQQPNFPFQRPLAGEWSDYFGHNISLNSKKGLITPNAVSLTTTRLTSVVSPQNAIVTKIETIEGGLNRVFLDHGRGVYSIISGITELTVEVSNGVVAGAVIGKLPSKSNTNKQGNAIKANRLIWQTIMNEEFVNPLLLTTLVTTK